MADLASFGRGQPSGGWKPTKPENPSFKCRVCGSDEIFYRVIDDIHDDLKYRCDGCGRTWISEGPDA